MTPPETLLGLAAVLIVTVGGWVTAWIQHRRQNVSLAAVEKQVNNRDRNLRDDVDELLDVVRDVRRDVRGIRQDMGEVRGELRDERAARVDLQRRVDQLGSRAHSEPP